MGNYKITKKNLIVLRDENITSDIKLEKGTEIAIVNDVIYINGLLLPPSAQNLFYNWITSNLDNRLIFFHDLRNFA